MKTNNNLLPTNTKINANLKNDYQYFCVLTEGGYFLDSLPMLVIPGSYIFFNWRKFYVAEYQLPFGEDADNYDICVYCIEEEDGDLMNFDIIRRDCKINTILKEI